MAQLVGICLQCGRIRRPGFDLWVGKIPWNRKWQPTPVFLLEKFHGQRSLVDYNPHDWADSTNYLAAPCIGKEETNWTQLKFRFFTSVVWEKSDANIWFIGCCKNQSSSRNSDMNFMGRHEYRVNLVLWSECFYSLNTPMLKPNL